jgi:polynucleotide 5'-hydroxyl-kinase GRC3/NOL9
MWEGSIDTAVQRIRTPETILILGASDTGKTTFAVELAIRLANNEPVAFVDADVGQSRIGPPTTIGWALLDNPQKDFSKFDTQGIFFVGAVSPAGHLLQFTDALARCVKQTVTSARIIIIDTPGFVANSAATSLWWAVQDILRPTRILLFERNEELSNFVRGVKRFDSQLEFIKTPPHVSTKSMSQRQAYRQQRFYEYFRNSSAYQLSLNNLGVQVRENITANMLVGRIIALRDSTGTDLAIGFIVSLDDKENTVYFKSPAIDVNKVACLIIGDVAYEGNDT